MRPVYTANGFQCFLLSVAAFLVFSDASPHGVGLFPATLVYDSYGEILTALTLGSFAFCGALYVKGLVAPSGPDGGSCGNPVIDFYWGLELYPRIAGWDVKQFTNCRWGMMCWALFPLSFAAKSMALSGGALHPAMAVNVALQLVYVAKFFWWETGYLATMDIQHDRAGWYICWGCLVWVPSVYVSHSLFLVHAAPAWCTPAAAAAIFAAGWAAIYINYDADRQRGLARETNGQCIIWGHAARTLPAEYRTEGVRDNRRRGARAGRGSARNHTGPPPPPAPRRARSRRPSSSPTAGGPCRATSTTCPKSSPRCAGRCPAASRTRCPTFTSPFSPSSSSTALFATKAACAQSTARTGTHT